MSEYIYAWDGTEIVHDEDRPQPVTELVRCRDCRYCDDREAERWDSTLAELYGEPPVYCNSPQWDGPYLHRSVKPDGFCAWGERREQ